MVSIYLGGIGLVLIGFLANGLKMVGLWRIENALWI
jgi:hypothetical protein